MKYMIIFLGFLGLFGAFIFGAILSEGKSDEADPASVREAFFMACSVVCTGGAIATGIAALAAAILSIIALFTALLP